jgi:hypothetical protein
MWLGWREERARRTPRRMLSDGRREVKREIVSQPSGRRPLYHTSKLLIRTTHAHATHRQPARQG